MDRIYSVNYRGRTYQFAWDSQSSRRDLLARAKRSCGLTSVRCEWSQYGDVYEIRPVGLDESARVHLQNEATCSR